MDVIDIQKYIPSTKDILSTYDADLLMKMLYIYSRDKMEKFELCINKYKARMESHHIGDNLDNPEEPKWKNLGGVTLQARISKLVKEDGSHIHCLSFAKVKGSAEDFYTMIKDIVEFFGECNDSVVDI
jgi:hypothetical protein